MMGENSLRNPLLSGLYGNPFRLSADNLGI